jgi:ATP-dependent protease ClpP protease subunit
MTDRKKLKSHKSYLKKYNRKMDKKEIVRGFQTIIHRGGCYTVKHLHTDKDIYDVYMSGGIGYQDEYHELMSLFRIVPKGTKINVYINNFGGMIHTGMQLIHSIRDSKADVEAIVDGAVYSMAPIIVLACPSIKLKPHAMFMFHDYKAMSMGSGQEIIKNAEATRKLTSSLLMDACHPFLTKKEIKSISEGTDIYVHHDDAVKRLKKHLDK